MSKFKKIMVLLPVSDPLQAPILQGIADYARTKRWALQINPEMPGFGIRHLVGWPGDGVFALLGTKAEVAVARTLAVPVVNLSGAVRDTGLPRVMVDQEAMGRLAAEHLLACGFSRFGYYGLGDMWYSQQRKSGFVARLKQDGFECSVLEPTIRFSARNPWYKWVDILDPWLKKLKPPVGLLAVHDYRAAVVVYACTRIGLRVPNDVAVVGVGNDVTTCEFAEIPLSSVSRNSQEVGRQAAALLDRLMAGQPPPPEDILVEPEGVVRRRSTDVFVGDLNDPEIAVATRFIHEHIGDPSLSTTMLGVVSISRRTLDLRFKKYLNCTPQEYIWQVRVDCSKRLLVRSDKPKLHQVAKACGFSGVRHFRTVFRRVTGMTPNEYRGSNKEF